MVHTKGITRMSSNFAGESQLLQNQYIHRRVLSWSWWAVLLFVAFTPLRRYSCAKYVHIFLLDSHQRLGKTEIKCALEECCGRIRCR